MRVMRKLPVVPICRTSEPLLKIPNHEHDARVPPRQEGRLPIVTNARRDAMDVMARATSAAKADGENVWSWHPWAGAKSAGDEPAGDGDYEVTDTGESTP